MKYLIATLWGLFLGAAIVVMLTVAHLNYNTAVYIQECKTGQWRHFLPHPDCGVRELDSRDFTATTYEPLQQ